MFQWSKTIASAERELWELQWETDPLPGVVLEEDLAAGTLRATAALAGRAEAEELRQRFGGEVASLQERDWVALGGEPWRKRWLEVRHCLVVSLDEDEAFLRELRDRYPERDLLVIPPELAFGTGDHETTAACLEEVVDFGNGREPGWSLLDLGTGTGILALAGFLSGARRVVATEMDAMALRIAKKNLVRNAIPPGSIELRQEDVLEWQPGERFHLVCANLYAGILQQLLPVLPRALRTGGCLCLSGILQTQEPDLVTALQAAGFHVERRTPRGKWVTLAARRDPALD